MVRTKLALRGGDSDLSIDHSATASQDLSLKYTVDIPSQQGQSLPTPLPPSSLPLPLTAAIGGLQKMC